MPPNGELRGRFPAAAAAALRDPLTFGLRSPAMKPDLSVKRTAAARLRRPRRPASLHVRRSTI